MYRGKHQCHICGEDAFCILLVGTNLPTRIDREATILKGSMPRVLGINCGCYAKFHRQVAHIITNMNIRHRNEPGWEKIPTP